MECKPFTFFDGKGCKPCKRPKILVDGKCIDCPDNSFFNGDGCQLCEPPKIVVDGKCMDCSGNSFFNGKRCQLCEPPKIVVDGKCIDCPDGNILVDGKCIGCPDNSFFNGNGCQLCEPPNIVVDGKCIDCRLPQVLVNGMCKECPQNQPLLDPNGNCVEMVDACVKQGDTCMEDKNCCRELNCVTNGKRVQKTCETCGEDMFTCKNSQDCCSGFTCSKNHMCIACQATPLDICFAIDGSGSIKPENFPLVKEFAVNLTTGLDEEVALVTTLKNMYGVSLFSTVVTKKYLVNSGTGTFKLGPDPKAVLSSLTFPGQATNTGAGIQACQELLETSTSGYPQILLLFSDGLPNRPSPGARQDTEAKANATKMAGITLVPAIVSLHLHYSSVLSDRMSVFIL